MRNLIIVIILLLTCFESGSQNVGIGTTTPAEKLDVLGHIKITGEIKPNGVGGQAGQVLTANGNGTMQWATTTPSTTGNGGWGNCSIYNIDSYQLVADSNGKTGDNMGWAVSISGDYAIVGSYLDDESGFVDNGSATIFKRNAATGVWEIQSKLINPSPQSGDNFGVSVSISGDYAIVGAHNDNEGGSNSGSATIFKRNSGNGLWESQGKLTNSSGLFGVSVFISGDYAIVGAPNDHAFGIYKGSATIYNRNSVTGIFQFQGKLMNPVGEDSDNFGYSVAISGDYAIVGAPFDDEDGLLDNGSATIFKRNINTNVWESQGKVIDLGRYLENNSNDNFGWSVGIFGDYAIIGAPNDLAFGYVGSATIFKRNLSTGVWERQIKLKGSNDASTSYPKSGYSVSISNDYAIVGAPTSSQVGAIENGSAIIHKRYENLWLPYQEVLYPYGINSFFFGRAVSLDGSNNRFVVGANGVFTNTGAAFFGRVK